MSVSAYPLQWPDGRPRKSVDQRRDGRFSRKVYNGRYNEKRDVTVADALIRLQDELDKLGARYPVVSTNVEARLDGRPRSNQPEPRDPGVALYFELNGKPHCMPCDTYSKVAHNIAAIAAHIEATRAVERHGVASIADMFRGFEALPAPGKADSQRWWVVLGIKVRDGRSLNDTPVEEIQAAYRKRASELHPDKPGGSAAAMSELNVARDQALKAVRGG